MYSAEEDEIIRHYKKHISARIGTDESVRRYFEGVEPAVVKLAVDKAVSDKRISIGYVDDLIKEWSRYGLITYEKVKNVIGQEIKVKEIEEKIIRKEVLVKETNRTIDFEDFQDFRRELQKIRVFDIEEEKEHINLYDGKFFTQIECYCKKYLGYEQHQINKIKEYCHRIDNSIVFRALMYARQIERLEFSYLETLLNRILEKGISTLKEFNSYLS